MSEVGRMVMDRVSITNSGSVYGTFTGQLLYLQEMSSWYLPQRNRTMEVHWFRTNRFGEMQDYPSLHKVDVHECVDQGLQSYLVFSGAFDRLLHAAFVAGRVQGGIGFLFDETGPVRTLVLGQAFACAQFDEAANTSTVIDGRIVNSLGQLTAVVHQWDRRCSATLQNSWLLGSHEAMVLANQRFEVHRARWDLRTDGQLVPIACPACTSLDNCFPENK